MVKDHLDQETSVSVALTESGFGARAKSRTVAVFDRLGGNIFELLNAPMERRAARSRALAQSEMELIAAATQVATQRLKQDPALTDRAISNHLARVLRGQSNIDGVLIEAMEDLKLQPPDEDGAAELDERFLGRFETYSMGASTEELQHKWGRVLAAEVRRPGTFSEKVMRIVDEMESGTAASFERICKHRLADVLPRCLVNVLEYSELMRLVVAGLLVDPGISGQVKVAFEITAADGTKYWTLRFEDRGFILDFDVSGIATAAFPNAALPLTTESGKPAVPVYILTGEAVAIASILPDAQEQALIALTNAISEKYPSKNLRRIDIRDDQIHLSN